MTLEEFFTEFDNLKGLYRVHIETIHDRRCIRLTNPGNDYDFCPITALIHHKNKEFFSDSLAIDYGCWRLNLDRKDARLIVLGADRYFSDELKDFTPEQISVIYDRLLTIVRSWQD